MTEHKKVTKINTYLGELSVGDKIKLSWAPGGIPERKYYTLFSIWVDSNNNIELGFSQRSIEKIGATYSWDGGNSIIKKGSLLKIIKGKVTNWRKEVENDI